MEIEPERLRTLAEKLKEIDYHVRAKPDGPAIFGPNGIATHTGLDIEAAEDAAAELRKQYGIGE